MSKTTRTLGVLRIRDAMSNADMGVAAIDMIWSLMHCARYRSKTMRRGWQVRSRLCLEGRCAAFGTDIANGVARD
eukprot:1763913-Rhodomonas_salina.4